MYCVYCVSSLDCCYPCICLSVIASALVPQHRCVISGRDERSVCVVMPRPALVGQTAVTAVGVQSTASDFEVKDMPASLILMLRFKLLICITYVFCCRGTLPVTLRAERSYKC